MERKAVLFGFVLFLALMMVSTYMVSADPMEFGITTWSDVGPVHCSMFDGNVCKQPAVNTTNTTDKFFYDGGLAYIVTNVTYQGNSSGQSGLNVTANFTQIGGTSSVASYEIGGGVYIFNDTYVNYASISSFNNVMDANITVWANDSNGNETNAIAFLMMVNMTFPGCPPPNEVPAGGWPAPPGFNQSSWSPVPPTQAQGCTQNTTLCNMTDTYGPGTWNGTAWVICAPNFGGTTTSFNTVAQSGNFSSVPNFTMDIPGKVKIRFLMNVSFTSTQSMQSIMEFGMKNLMSAGRVGINESEWDGNGTRPNLTISAELTIYNITGLLGITDPYIGYGSFNGTDDPTDLQTCPADRCSGISWDGENLTFSVSSFSTYVIGNTTHNITFQNLTVKSSTYNTLQNATYIMRITHWGNATQEDYNLSLNGTGTLNTTFITLNYSDHVDVEINVSNTTAGLYSTYIIANHWNGTDMETGWNLSSADDNITLSTGFYPDFNVSNIQWNSTDSNHPLTGSNVTINATINNIGSYNFTGDIRVWLYWDGSKIANETVSNSNLVNGTSTTIIFDEITSDSIVTNGEHTIVVEADTLDNVTEYNESNNNRTLELLIGFNVTITGLIYNGTSYTTTAPALMANESFTINISVAYGNGDPVTNISRTNLTFVCDGACGTRNWGTTGYQTTSLGNFTNVSSGSYSFDIVAYYNPTGPGPGTRNLTMVVGMVGYSGSSSGLDYYHLMVPSFTVTFGSLLTSISEEYADAFYVYATNTGTETLYNTTGTITDNHDYLTFTACSGSSTVANDTNGHSVCNPTMTALAVTADQNGCFSASVGGKSNGLYFNATSILQCIDVLNGGSGPTGGTGPSGSTCSTDADCATGYYCSTGGSCLKKAYSISITSYTSALDVDWGSYVTTKVTVKNDGSNTFVAKLLTTLTGLETTVLPESMTLNPGNAIMFTVNISAPETASIGEHTGTIKAYVNEDSTVYQTKPITITVLTTEEKKEELNETYYNYSSVIDDLKELFDRLKAIGFINQSDIDLVEGLINDTYDDLGLVKTALDGDDYATADSILILMNTTLNGIRTQIDDLQGEQGGAMGLDLSGAWLWIVIGIVIVIVAVFLVYLLMPTGKKRYGTAYKPVIKEGFFSKIGKKFKRDKKSKWKPIEPGKFNPAYEKGYERIRTGAGYAYSKGKKQKIKGEFGRIKKKLKRKKPQKDMRDFFSS